jgi:DNA replication protein DnaC
MERVGQVHRSAVSVSDCSGQIKSTWDRGSKKTEAQAIAELLSPHSADHRRDWRPVRQPDRANLFYEVINGRYQAMLPTVVISNLSRNELIEVIGGRSFDRLRENGGFATFDWESHRGR